jgi:hypothetical protein
MLTNVQIILSIEITNRQTKNYFLSEDIFTIILSNGHFMLIDIRSYIFIYITET